MGGRGSGGSSGGGGGGGGGLQGSEKQVAWAKTIIVGEQSAYNSHMNNMAHHSLAQQPRGRNALLKAYQDTWKNASNQASWWIDHRGGRAANVLADQADKLFHSKMRNK